jgi:hypothetical protein
MLVASPPSPWPGLVVTKGLAELLENMRRKAAPSSAISIRTSSSDQLALTSTLLAAKSMAFLHEVAEPVDHARIAAA